MGHLTAGNLPSGCQHSFVSGGSCSINLSALETWMLLIDEGSSVCATYLDFATVFESVPHERLL